MAKIDYAYSQMIIYIYIYIYIYTHTFSHLADAFIQSDLQMRTLEAIKTTKEQQHASAMTSLG